MLHLQDECSIYTVVFSLPVYTSMTTSITLPSACDFHLHLRQGDMMRMVTPKVEQGGVSLAYIMVNI